MEGFSLENHKWVDTLMTNYKMELRRLSQEDINAKYDDIELVSIKDKGIDYYLKLWQSVGKPYNWSSRLRMSKSEILERVFLNPNEIVYEIRYQDKVVGISEYKIELNGEYATTQGEVYVELMFFALSDQYQGKGLGKKAIYKTIQDILHHLKINKIILQTCQLDSQGALSFYQKCGFDVFKTWNETENIIFYD